MRSVARAVAAATDAVFLGQTPWRREDAGGMVFVRGWGGRGFGGLGGGGYGEGVGEVSLQRTKNWDQEGEPYGRGVGNSQEKVLGGLGEGGGLLTL